MTSQTSPSQAQGPILKLIDFVDDIVSVGPKFRQNMTILVTYCLFGGLALSCWHHFSDKDFSFLLTLSGCVQTLAFFLLLHKIRVQKSVAGISSKTLQVYVFVFIFRLSSTLVKNGSAFTVGLPSSWFSMDMFVWLTDREAFLGYGVGNLGWSVEFVAVMPNRCGSAFGCVRDSSSAGCAEVPAG